MARVRGWEFYYEGCNSHCCFTLTKTDVVLCNFDESVGCPVMIVTECGLIVQQRFVMVGQTVIHRLLASLDVPQSVEKSAGSVQS